MTRGILDPATYYYRRLMTDAVLAVDAAATCRSSIRTAIVVTRREPGRRPRARGRRRSPTGLAGAVVDVPFLCALPARRRGHRRDAVRRAPRLYLRTHRRDEEQVFRTLSLLRRALLRRPGDGAGAVLASGSRTRSRRHRRVFAAYNEYAGPKEIRVWPFSGHEAPEHGARGRAASRSRPATCADPQASIAGDGRCEACVASRSRDTCTSSHAASRRPGRAADRPGRASTRRRPSLGVPERADASTTERWVRSRPDVRTVRTADRRPLGGIAGDRRASTCEPASYAGGQRAGPMLYRATHPRSCRSPGRSAHAHRLHRPRPDGREHGSPPASRRARDRRLQPDAREDAGDRGARAPRRPSRSRSWSRSSRSRARSGSWSRPATPPRPRSRSCSSTSSPATRSSTAATRTSTTTSAATTALAEKGIGYVDAGTSGGIWGLQVGYALMVGGEDAAVKPLEPIFHVARARRAATSTSAGRARGTT